MDVHTIGYDEGVTAPPTDRRVQLGNKTPSLDVFWLNCSVTPKESTAGRESQQILLFGLLVCGVMCMLFIWLNVALLGAAG